ncbi:ADP-ribosylation factor-like protein 10 isoform 2-T2 [Liasis olivaceus]
MLLFGENFVAASASALEMGQPHYCEYQVLVLGLDGAGKSTILHYVCSPEAKKCIAPTQGFNSMQLQANGLQMDLLEVGGSQNLRFYWNQYLSKAHILVFVVDSADGPRLHIARQELHCLLAEDPQLPLIVLANKQDKNDALSMAELQEELALHNLESQRKFFLLPTSATYAGLATANSVLHLKHLLVKLLTHSSKMDSL